MKTYHLPVKPTGQKRARDTISHGLAAQGEDTISVENCSTRREKLLYEMEGRPCADHGTNKLGDLLGRSKNQFQLMADLTADLLWDSQADGATMWYNQRWMDYTGQKFEEAIGWGWVDAIHPDDRAGSAERYADAVRAGKPLRQEHRIRRFDGEYRWYVVSSYPMKNKKGNVIKMYGAASDIHDRKLAEEASIENAKRQSFLLKLTDLLRDSSDPCAIVSTSLNQLVQHLGVGQASYLRVIGHGERAKALVYDQGSIDSSHYANQISYKEVEKKYPLVLLNKEKVLAVENTLSDHKLPYQVRNWWQEERIGAAIAVMIDGKRKPQEYFVVFNEVARKWTDMETTLLGEAAERISNALERHRYQDMLKARERKIKKLETARQRKVFAESLYALELERKKTAESMHTGIGQLLFGTRLVLSGLTQEMERESFQKSKTYAMDLLKESIEETRRISHGLMPAALEEFGFKSALEIACRQLSGGIKFSCRIKELTGRVDKPVEVAIYRMAQELMNNVHKHSGAETCSVDIKMNRQCVSLLVVDNGKGMREDFEEIKGIGLASIRNNVKLLGGTIAIRTEKDKGTEIAIAIPWARTKKNN